ncbi:M28 family peptidase [Autumnicola musiva]|uniref:M28 family peptidase n=1 Tax=Autumnicola musiva TaxID=3075589 RepID=A0ABU3DAL9_9FLAO|nr:M28 family peptidase [Zunongwangia sp. F117]MDT0678583.1 M28 family peptidase [Zunongwangia sp. F117]
MKTICTLFAILCLLIVNAQDKRDSLPPALSAIQQSELRKDLYELASDKMRGRRAGTLDELRAAAWVAQKAREAGLEPAGNDGTYFQFFPLYRRVVSNESSLEINEKELSLWEEAWTTSPVEANIDESITWLESMADTTLNLQDKVVAMHLIPPSRMPAEGISLWVYRYALSAIREQSAVLKRQNVSAIVLIADSTATSEIGFFGHGFEEGTYAIEPQSRKDQISDTVPVILVSRDWARELQKADSRLSATLKINEFTYPSANVMAKVSGTDAELQEEYVLFSAHHDHDGIGAAVEGDSIWNGADDNATVSVALLAIGRAWKKNPGKRSALFVWHGAEERGLFGSKYFVKNPPVNKDNIVAVLNGDMIGRNNPDAAALLGSIPPHRNSIDLVNMAMAANKQITNFNVDTSWDASSHPEFWYYRSDHLPYAQANIPAIFFSTLLHPDYHTPKDEADKIDIDKLTKMTKWMYGTGWKVSQEENAPVLENE